MTQAANPVEVNTTQYQFSHGKAPRGAGHWIFAIGRNGAWTEFQPTGLMTYGAAKRLAIAEARSLGAWQVVVQP